MADMLATDFYLVAAYSPRAGYGRTLTVKVTKNAPRLAANERAIKMAMQLPKSLFLTPQLTAEIRVPDNDIPAPMISTEVLDNIQEQLQQQLGASIELRLVEPGQPEAGGSL